MNITKEQWSKVIGAAIAFVLVLLSIFGYDVGVVQPREEAIAGVENVGGFGAQSAYGKEYEALIVTKRLQSMGETDISGSTTTLATLTVSGATALNGGLTMDTNKFIVANTSGNTAIAGTLTVTGTATALGATALDGGLTMDTNKFIVANTSGNTAIAGTLTVTGTATALGATALDGGLTMDTNKFVVANTSGNTDIAGTLTVTGTTDFNGAMNVDANGDFDSLSTLVVDSDSYWDSTGDMQVNDNLNITGTLTVAGTSDLQGAVSDSGGSFTIADDAVVTGTLTLESVAFSGPITFGSASAVVTGTEIAHGLGVTPTSVVLTPMYNGVFTNTVYVVGTNVTSITVGLGYAEGVTTVTKVYWMAGK